ncbi:hypothetical protein BCV70DRAFT_197939 [Testicularia cyperi]|uniref:ER membrane protein complex subunit 7 beta-sandwich domain-containing protein n=1 Tax=Testicularia cyperi TaxID=1882483 RepID=A0A317Y100_9BASI|nr:hypothetical protein BCV70DRAFT_197939 [Testicularia cyperi]
MKAASTKLGLRWSSALVLVAATLLQACLASQDVRGQIQPNAELGHLHLLGPNMKVVLLAMPSSPVATTTDAASPAEAQPEAVPHAADSTSTPPASPAVAAPVQPQEPLALVGQQRDRVTWVSADGSFIFKDVDQGAYTLEVVSRTHKFNQYRIDVPAKSAGKAPQIRLFTPGTSLTSIKTANLVMHPLILHALKRNDFFTEAAPLTLGSLVAMAGGPVMLLGLLAMGLVFVLPKLTAALDPDAQKDLAQSQAKLNQRMAAIQSGNIGALLAPAPASSSSSSSAAAAPEQKPKSKS